MTSKGAKGASTVQRPLLKDEFFSPTVVRSLADGLSSLRTNFHAKDFSAFVLQGWDELELKARMRRISTGFRQFLPRDYATAVGILERLAPQVRGFAGMVFPDFVEVYGTEHYERSIRSLEFFTTLSSSEFAVRPFLRQYGHKMEQQMLVWAGNENHHIRRLASEGFRPRLPWAAPLPHLQQDPTPILPVLERLRDDPSDYVRRSVANNLNDISKDHPDLVVRIAQEWKNDSPLRTALLRHACRTLLKSGRQDALAIFGQARTTSIDVTSFAASPSSIPIGSSVQLFAVLQNTSKSPVHVRVSYAVHFRRPGDKASRKVFAWKIVDIKPKGMLQLEKKHAFAQLSTRKHYEGPHDIHIIVNGVDMSSIVVDLTTP